ncbi:YchJ family protein [uncultured Thiodictyon sp.]|uniref:YchJ family protein n=1 Tax=uncultured Thiodictyon sp. TaxID=1846217 RepID=UPI0025E30331|nr:YchJ family protein [uncultured Thiodictyon sp.]
MNTKAPIPDPCPCGSPRAYPDCCGPLIAGTALPQTAEQLMRSRYSAYTRGEADYLRATWHPTTRQQDVALDESVRWLGLKIVATEAGGAADRRGLVEFVARYKLGGRAHRLHERSRFKRFQGRWYYVDGDLQPAP